MVKQLKGTPKVYVMTPPPLMQANPGWPTMQTTINTLFPKLIPLMQKATPGVLGPIDIFSGMGGCTDWMTNCAAQTCTKWLLPCGARSCTEVGQADSQAARHCTAASWYI